MMRCLAVLLATLAVGPARAATELPMPLQPADPQRPLELVADHTWQAVDLAAVAGRSSRLQLPPFTYDASKGRVQLVVDYAALRTSTEDGYALVEVSIECPEARQPCAVPMQDTVIGIRSEYMGTLEARVDGVATPLQVARGARSYRFDDQTVVSLSLEAKEHTHFDPKAIRARLVYGPFDETALPGQPTRGSAFWNIAGVVIAGALLLLWWLRR